MHRRGYQDTAAINLKKQIWASKSELAKLALQIGACKSGLDCHGCAAKLLRHRYRDIDRGHG